jgi:WD40 repeat protein
VSGSLDTTLRTWDVATMRQTAQFNGHSDYVLSAAYLQTGDWLLSGAFYS